MVKKITRLIDSFGSVIDKSINIMEKSIDSVGNQIDRIVGNTNLKNFGRNVIKINSEVNNQQNQLQNNNKIKPIINDLCNQSVNQLKDVNNLNSVDQNELKNQLNEFGINIDSNEQGEDEDEISLIDLIDF